MEESTVIVEYWQQQGREVVGVALEIFSSLAMEIFSRVALQISSSEALEISSSPAPLIIAQL